jgi:hypothetical protein
MKEFMKNKKIILISFTVGIIFAMVMILIFSEITDQYKNLAVNIMTNNSISNTESDIVTTIKTDGTCEIPNLSNETQEIEDTNKSEETQMMYHDLPFYFISIAFIAVQAANECHVFDLLKEAILGCGGGFRNITESLLYNDLLAEINAERLLEKNKENMYNLTLRDIESDRARERYLQETSRPQKWSGGIYYPGRGFESFSGDFLPEDEIELTETRHLIFPLVDENGKIFRPVKEKPVVKPEIVLPNWFQKSEVEEEPTTGVRRIVIEADKTTPEELDRLGRVWGYDELPQPSAFISNNNRDSKPATISIIEEGPSQKFLKMKKYLEKQKVIETPIQKVIENKEEEAKPNISLPPSNYLNVAADFSNNKPKIDTDIKKPQIMPKSTTVDFSKNQIKESIQKLENINEDATESSNIISQESVLSLGGLAAATISNNNNIDTTILNEISETNIINPNRQGSFIQNMGGYGRQLSSNIMAWNNCLGPITISTGYRPPHFHFFDPNENREWFDELSWAKRQIIMNISTNSPGGQYYVDRSNVNNSIESLKETIRHILRENYGRRYNGTTLSFMPFISDWELNLILTKNLDPTETPILYEYEFNRYSYLDNVENETVDVGDDRSSESNKPAESDRSSESDKPAESGESYYDSDGPEPDLGD